MNNPQELAIRLSTWPISYEFVQEFLQAEYSAKTC